MEGREQEEETDGTGLQQVHRVGVLEQTDGGLLWQVHRVRGSGGDSWGGAVARAQGGGFWNRQLGRGLWQVHRVRGSGGDRHRRRAGRQRKHSGQRSWGVSKAVE